MTAETTVFQPRNRWGLRAIGRAPGSEAGRPASQKTPLLLGFLCPAIFSSHLGDASIKSYSVTNCILLGVSQKHWNSWILTSDNCTLILYLITVIGSRSWCVGARGEDVCQACSHRQQVAQIYNLLYRRFLTCQTLAVRTCPKTSAPCRLQIGVTPD